MNSTPPPRALHSSRAYRLLYPWLRFKFAVAGGLLAPRLRVTGRHHVPGRGGVLLTPNHTSDIDWPYLFAVTPRPLWFMAKSEMFQMGLLGPLITLLQAFPVQRGTADRAALRYSEQLLQAGQALVIFPEGRCSPTGAMQPINAGAALIALHAQVPVVPVGIDGTTRVLPYESLTPRPSPAPLRIHFGKPVLFADIAAMPRREQRAAATARLEAALRAAVAVARGAGKP